MFRKTLGAFSKVLQWYIIGLIKIYQYCISPAFCHCCRFYPTCSVYAKTAIERHGVFEGSLLSIWRLLRCHPLSPGGYDPVPNKQK